MAESNGDEPEGNFSGLNEADPTIDAWRTPRPDLQTGRTPGLINLQRYPLAHAASGIATFLGRPAALTPADLRAAQVDVAMRRTARHEAAAGPRPWPAQGSAAWWER
jgi:hypothetical protein